MKIIKDKGSYVLVESQNWQGRRVLRKIKRWRCVGGPLDGQTRYAEEFGPNEQHYKPFNNAGTSRFSCIFAWIEE